jgi:hypothetical protein
MTRFDNAFQTDGAKLLKYITTGLLLAAVGIVVIIVGNTIRTGSTSLFNAINYENNLNFWSSFISYSEYLERSNQSTQAGYWITAATYLFKAVGQIAVVFGLILALLGFLGCAFNHNNEDKMRLVCLIASCVILFVMFTGMLTV